MRSCEWEKNDDRFFDRGNVTDYHKQRFEIAFFVIVNPSSNWFSNRMGPAYQNIDLGPASNMKLIALGVSFFHD